MNRILFITPFTPSNHGAGVSYSKQLINELSNNNIIDIFYYCYKEDIPYNSNKNINILKRKKINVINKCLGVISLPLFFPLFTSRFSWFDLIFIINRINHVKYKYIYFDFSQTFSYSFFIKHPNKILMSHDIIFQRYTRMKSKFLPWIKMSEKLLLKTGTIFTFSEKDNLIIKNEYGLDSYNTTFFLNSNVINSIPTSNNNYFIFFAAWGRFDNDESLEWFIDKVYIPYNLTICIKIIGKGLSKKIQEKISLYKNIKYLGFVDNPYPIISNAKALISPLHYGAGVKVKCIDSLACGTPIIGTKIAFEGISSDYADFMILADTPEEYYNTINTLTFKLDDKITFKNKFINSYQEKTIINFINK